MPKSVNQKTENLQYFEGVIGRPKGLRKVSTVRSRWRFVGSSGRDPVTIDGIDILGNEARWESTGEPARVIDPHYGAEHTFSVFRLRVDGRVVEFAAGEFSAGVYGVYVRE